jgi:hypothetical protein
VELATVAPDTVEMPTVVSEGNENEELLMPGPGWLESDDEENDHVGLPTAQSLEEMSRVSRTFLTNNMNVRYFASSNDFLYFLATRGFVFCIA